MAGGRGERRRDRAGPLSLPLSPLSRGEGKQLQRCDRYSQFRAADTIELLLERDVVDVDHATLVDLRTHAREGEVDL
jgi:hypothetical protein